METPNFDELLERFRKFKIEDMSENEFKMWEQVIVAMECNQILRAEIEEKNKCIEKFKTRTEMFYEVTFEEMQKSAGKIGELEGVVKNSEVRIRDLEGVVKDLEVNKVKDKERWEKREKYLQDEWKKVQNSNAEKAAALREQKDLQGKLDETTKDYDNLYARFVEMETDLKKLNHRNLVLSGEARALQGQMAQLNDHNLALNRSLRDTQENAASKKNEFNQEINKLKNELNQEINKLKKAHEAQVDKLKKAHEEQVNRLMNHVRSLQNSATYRDQAREELAKQMEVKEQVNKTLQAELDSLKSALDAIEDYEVKKAKMESQTNQLSELRSHLTSSLQILDSVTK